MNNFYSYFLLFLIYSFLGWVMEVIYTLITDKHLVNRGFLIGPLCPIYGSGALLITLLLKPYQDNLLILFIMSLVVCSILEYATSYVMEKVFKTRWWDYSDKKFNINGRICLNTMIPFGILGCSVVYFINPLIYNIFSKIDYSIIRIIALILLTLFIIDYIFSFNIIFKIRDTITNFEKDSTEEISKKIRAFISDKGKLYRRLMDAFPDMISPKERLEHIKNWVNKELEKYEIYKK